MSGTADNPLLRAALWYADLGYPVFPCMPAEKRPLTEHGLLDATTDAEQIERWVTASPWTPTGRSAPPAKVSS